MKQQVLQQGQRQPCCSPFPFIFSVHYKRIGRGRGRIPAAVHLTTAGQSESPTRDRDGPRRGDSRGLGSVSGCLLLPLPPLPLGGRTQPTKRTLRSVCCCWLFTCRQTGRLFLRSYRETGGKEGDPAGKRSGSWPPAGLSAQPAPTSQEPETLHGHLTSSGQGGSSAAPNIRLSLSK